MKGLLVKDFCQLIRRGRSVVFLLAFSLMMGLMMDGSFVMGFLGMLSLVFTIGLACDEFENGYAFLLTLPLTRNMYVSEKYLFSAAGSMAGLVLGSGICMVCGLIRGEDAGIAFTDIVMFIPVIFMILSISLPVQLLFGAERSRYVLFVIGGGGMAIGYVGNHLFPELGNKILQFLDRCEESTLLGGALLLSIGFLCLSWIWAQYIMKRKEL